MNRQTWLALLLCTLLLLPNLGRAATLAEAVEEATRNLAQGRIDQSTERKIIVQVVNKASQKTDDLSGRVETELYRTLAKAFPSFELVSLSEAQGGVNLSKVVVVRGETEPRGVLVGLKIFASVGLKGTLLAQAQTELSPPGDGAVQKFGGFPGHAEAAAAYDLIHVLRGAAEEGELQVMDRAGAVQGHGGDPPLLHQADEPRGQAGLDLDVEPRLGLENRDALFGEMIGDQDADLGGHSAIT